MRSRSLADSLFYARRGLVYALVSQRNMKVHLLASVVVILAGSWLKIERWEWAVLVLTMALVITAEIINTAIECSVDLVTREMQPLARKAKDAAAGAVLLAASSAVIIGLLIFWPHFQQLFS